MKEFFKRNRFDIALAAVLIVLTVLLCIPVTLKFIAGIFGYAAYFYLVLGYVFLFLHAKKLRFDISKGRWTIYILSVVFALLTLHVGICGEEMINSGFGGYVGGSYDNPTVAGVVFSLLSLPIVLPCKYVASVSIFFVVTAIFVFLALEPLIFVNKRAQKKKPILRKAETEEKPQEPVEHKREETEPTLYSDPIPQPQPFVVAEKPEPLNVITEETPLTERERAEKRAKELLGIPDTGSKRVVRREEPVAPTQPAQTNLGTGVDLGFATIVEPDYRPYTSNFLMEDGDKRAEARKKLFDDLESFDFDEAEAKPAAEKTVGETIEETTPITAFLPKTEIIDTGVPEFPAFHPIKEPTATEEPTVLEPDDEDEETEILTEDNLTSDEKTEEPIPYKVDEDVVSEEISDEEAEEVEDLEDVEETDEEEEEEPPKVTENSFAAAVRQTDGVDAPKPLTNPEAAFKPMVASPKPVVQETKPATEAPKEIVPETPKMKKPYDPPKLSLLEDHIVPGFSPVVENYAELKEVFEVKLKNFGVDCTLIDTVKGPTVTLCILELGERCSITKVIGLKKDIARLLKSPSDINVVEKIKGTIYFGIEVPNEVRGMVSFKEVVGSKDYIEKKGDLLVALGKDTTGNIIVEDIADMPHALIAGTTGSGKSVCLNTIIASILFRYSPDEVKLVLVDMKVVEMAIYEDLPHMLFRRPLTEVNDVINAMKWLSEETLRRFNVFRTLYARNLNEYNAKVEKEKQLPRILIIIDEASELMTNATARKPIEATASTLARLARAAGIHMIFATQNPVKEVITGEIQNNLPTRIALSVSDWNHSMIILKKPDAQVLLGHGDMLIKKGGKEMVRVQGANLNEAELSRVVQYVKEHNEVEFDDEFIEKVLKGAKDEAPPAPAPEISTSASLLPEKKNLEEDEKFVALAIEALKIFVETNKVSATYIQRRFSKGYNTVADLMDYLHDKGYISEPVNNKRSLLITKEQFYRLYPDKAPLGDDAI